MKKTTIISLIAVVIIAGGLVWYSVSQNSSQVVKQNNPADNSQAQQASQEQSANIGLSTMPLDTSDAALNQDLQTIDNQLNNLKTDNSAIDQSLNSL